MQNSGQYDPYIMVADKQAFTDNARNPEKTASVGRPQTSGGAAGGIGGRDLPAKRPVPAAGYLKVQEQPPPAGLIAAGNRRRGGRPAVSKDQCLH